MHDVTWTHPDIDEEANELKRVALENSFDYDAVRLAIEAGELVPLDSHDWMNLRNTDSFDIDLEGAKSRAGEYHKNIESIIDVFENDGSLPAPIVLRLNDGSLTLVAGNTRLMVASAYDVVPIVWRASMKDVTESLRSYIELIVERKMREADVTGGKRVPHGSSAHMKDLEKRIADLIPWRDKQRRGSESRSNYSRLISRLRGELASAKRAATKITKSDD